MKLLTLLWLLLVIAGCATTPKPPSDYLADARIDTLSSDVSLSVQASDRRLSGRGVLVYRRPDQMHLVVLSPLGTVVVDAFANGDRVALLYPGQSVAFVGALDDLPDKGGLQGWKMLRWLLDADPIGNTGFSGTVDGVGRSGRNEQVTYENGLPVSRVLEGGDQIHYGRYAVVGGIPVAREYELRTRTDDRLRIRLEEPEVNGAVESGTFVPSFEGMRVYPLSALEGL